MQIDGVFTGGHILEAAGLLLVFSLSLDSHANFGLVRKNKTLDDIIGKGKTKL